jgi:hypothetical protein
MTDTARPPLFTAIALDFPPAQRVGAQVEYRHSPHQRLYGVAVYFVGPEPAQKTIDRVLRECAVWAATHRGDLDICMHAYLLPDAGTDHGQRRTLSPYGRDFFLCFDAALCQVGVRRVGAKRFARPFEITPVERAGVVAAIAESVHPLDDDAGMDAEADDATDDMRGLVREWTWYGYASAAEIGARIDHGAAAGDGFDRAGMHAYAAAVLAKKRAAEATWPADTDTDIDRLDRAFAQLDAQGICALQCTGDTLRDGYEAVSDVIHADGVPADRYTGFCFFHGQDENRALRGEGLMLAFGHIESEAADAFIAVGRQVCAVLAQHGLQTDWNGSDGSRITLGALRWQRRTPG